MEIIALAHTFDCNNLGQILSIFNTRSKLSFTISRIENKNLQLFLHPTKEQLQTHGENDEEIV